MNEPDLLRQAAALMYTDHPRGHERYAMWRAMSDMMDFAAIRWASSFQATQQPSRGIDEPPAVHYGDPEAAARSASHHVRHELRVAREYLAARAL